MSTPPVPSPAFPLPEDLVIREPKVFEGPEFTNGEPTLSADEISFFKENGFLVKHGLLNEPETFGKIIDYAWGERATRIAQTRRSDDLAPGAHRRVDRGRRGDGRSVDTRWVEVPLKGRDRI